MATLIRHTFVILIEIYDILQEFPDALPDRYRELLRVIRQWRNLKQQQNAGLAYTGQSNTKPGGLALFCPACPQPDINLPADWQEDQDRYTYMFFPRATFAELVLLLD